MVKCILHQDQTIVLFEFISQHGAETLPISPFARVKVPLPRLATKFRLKFLTSDVPIR